jgi:hypothetical protein
MQPHTSTTVWLIFSLQIDSRQRNDDGDGSFLQSARLANSTRVGAVD